jgi:mono/diheme cytochrome c family protein
MADSTSDSNADSAADAGAVSTADASADATAESASDGAPAAQTLEIVATNGGALRGAPGEALNLAVVFVLADGGTAGVPSERVSWTAPVTIVAQDPSQPGPSSVLPEAGAQPTAFFVNNSYSGQYGPGALFIVDRGDDADASVKVVASVSDAGEVSAWVAIAPAVNAGDPVRGRSLFQSVSLAENLTCANCHGMTGAGSPAIDEGEAGTEYELPSTGGDLYTYPAPGLNDMTTASGPNLAADPGWNAQLFGVAIQADIDNNGVALRGPMPDFFQAVTDDAGATLSAQDVADIYAWLKTQTQ